MRRLLEVLLILLAGGLAVDWQLAQLATAHTGWAA